MEEKKEVKQLNETNEIKELKDVKEVKKPRKIGEEETIIAYSQLVFHTLQNSSTEITPKSIREEVKMFYSKFGNQEVKRLASIIIKEKKEKK